MKNSLSLWLSAIMLLGGVCDIHAQQKCVPPPSGMVAWLAFDETAGTVAANRMSVANQGSLNYGPTWVTGMVSNGLNFDGQEDSVNVPHYPEINFGDGDFSMDAWVRVPNQVSNDTVRTLLDKRSTPAGTGYMFFLYKGRIALQLLTNPAGFQNFINTTGPLVSTGKWQHIAVTINRKSSAGVTFYVDGVKTGNANPTTRLGTLDNNTPLRIGAEGQTKFFLGVLDELELFNRVLTPEEVKSIFNAQGAGKCKTKSK